MRGKRGDILRCLGGLAMAAVLVVSQLLGALAPAVAYAADGTTITFPNGGTATMHDDGTITGMGSHADLLASNKAYQEIYHSQVKEDAPAQGGADKGKGANR